MKEEARQRAAICEIGQRVYARGYAAGPDGNLSCRLGADRVLCTPTQICKGFMRPEDLCVVDLAGKLLSGPRAVTSEVRLHLEIYRAAPRAQAVVHCHPPHVLAFSITRGDIPPHILSEVEIYLGGVPSAPYETPGTQAFAETVRPYIGRANTVVLRHHGTVSWGPSLERAFWFTEILDNYCRVLLLAEPLGPAATLPPDKVAELAVLHERFSASPPDAPAQDTSAS